MRSDIQRATCLIGFVALLFCCVASVAAADGPATFKHGEWPFLPLALPVVPAVDDGGWCENNVDRFIWSALAKASLRPSRPADTLMLLRRVSFDLTGLPPTPQQQADFLADQSPDAYLRVVDRLLASPAYGERWAQHWLDLVRYAESDGFKEDALRGSAFRYRDYVIRALNADLPYDRFINQQLAGDELEPDNPDALVATGYLRLYPDEYNAANVRQRRQEILDDITGTTSLVMLGLTMGCAKCHDHKFDEVLQADYYRLQAFFTPLLPRDDVPLASPDQLREHQARTAAWEEATRPVRTKMDELLAPVNEKLMGEALEKFDAEIRAAVTTPADQRTALQKVLVVQAMKYIEPKLRTAAAQLKGEQTERWESLSKELASFDSLRPPPLPTAMAVGDAGSPPPPTFILSGGNYERPADTVEPGFPRFLGESSPDVHPPAVAQSTGRRAALARWLTRPDHPLTARVIVNRIWQQHFGEGIVGTGNDFGAMGDLPTHPELLDYLACELVDSGWSLKSLHRLLVTSAAYQQTSLFDPADAAQTAARKADPTNSLLWRARRRRLEGEAVRDAMLQVSGALGRRMFGASVRPELPAAVTGAWKPDDSASERDRRSIYLLVKRNVRYPLFEAFDQPDLHNSCARRTRTTTATQSLALLNGELALAQAQRWAAKLLAEHGEQAANLIHAAYIAAFARPPRESELLAAEQFFEKGVRNRIGLSAAVTDFCHALLNSNEFLYVD